MSRIRMLFGRLSRLGVDASLPSREAKHVILTNQLAVFTTFVFGLAALNPRLEVFPPAVRIGCVAGALIAPLVLLLNHFRRHLWAAWALVLGLDAGFLYMGRFQPDDSETVIFLINMAMVGWFVFSPAHRASRLAATALALACMVGLDWTQHRFPPSWVIAESDVRLIAITNRVLALIGVAMLSFFAARETARVEDALDVERARSDRLLHNILPHRIAEQLKGSDGAIAERFDEATVLFADIVRFTELSEKLPPAEVVAILDDIFTKFDGLADRFGVEKIKTIGDAYMVAAGIPEARPDHAEAIAEMALEMRSIVDHPKLQGLAIRIGVHTGPVVAGVIGKRKFVYDLWGDTVNTASRMESHGEPGKIQVSQAFHARLRERFEFEARGPTFIKGKGEMSTFFLTGPRHG